MAANYKILVLNGPNLNMLGKREPEQYGTQTLADIDNALMASAKTLGVSLETFQTNSESALIERIHAAWQKVDFIIINPAAFTHTSVALRDALLSVAIPFYEVHISNVHAREPFRHHSYLSDVAQGVVCGFGTHGYSMALTAAVHVLNTQHT